MVRLLVFLALTASLVSAVSLYAIGHRTRLLADKTADMAREVQSLEREIAVLRAERAYLLRPARIEPLARELGLGPVTGDQFTSREALARAPVR